MPKLTKEQLEQVQAGTHYVCASCDRFLEKGREDQEALEESRRIFGKVPDDLLELVCQACFDNWVTRSPVRA